MGREGREGGKEERERRRRKKTLYILLFSYRVTSLILKTGAVLLLSPIMTHCCSLLWYWNALQKRNRKHHSSPWCQWAIYISRGIPMRYKEYKSSPNQFTNRKTNYIFSNTSKSHFICKTICKMKSLDSVILKILSCFEDLVNI